MDNIFFPPLLNMCDWLLAAGASWLSWGLVKGAEFTGKAIHVGASKLREHITPEDKPTHVSPTVTKGLHVAKQATGGAVKVSQFLGDWDVPKSGSRGAKLAGGHETNLILMLCNHSGWRVHGGQPCGPGVGATCEEARRQADPRVHEEGQGRKVNH